MVVHKMNFIDLTWESMGEQTPKPDYSMIRRSDVATVSDQMIIWINGTQPVMDPHDAPPDSMFSFTRVASATVSDFSLTYLHHQINVTTFVDYMIGFGVIFGIFGGSWIFLHL